MGTRLSKGTYSLWSDLPPELAGLVLGRLPSSDDRIRFGFVCRHWRHGAREWSPPAAAPLLPWLNFMDRECSFQSLRSGDLKVCHHQVTGSDDEMCTPLGRRFPGRYGMWCIGSFDNWLLFLKCVGRHRSYWLENPISGAILTLPAAGDDDSEQKRARPGVQHIHSFIVCSTDLVVARIETSDGPAIACCRPGASSSRRRSRSPTWSTRSYRYRYQGIAFHHGKVYGVTRGELFAHEVIISEEDENYSRPSLSPAKKVIDGMFSIADLYLVASSCTGKLLMVRRRIGTVTAPLSFQVFEADLETSRWKKTGSLGDDEVLFVSAKFSKSVSAAASHGGHDLRRNHIYFLGDYFHYPGSRSSISCGMYDLSNDTFRSIQVVDHMQDKLTAAWFFPRRE